MPLPANLRLDPPSSEAIRRWCALAVDAPLDEAARQLFAFPTEVRAWAALAALRLALGEDDPDPEWERPRRVAEAIDAWIRAPGPETLARVRDTVGAAESAWNAVAGDSGQPEPTWQAATYAGWVVTRPDQPWSVVHAIGG